MVRIKAQVMVVDRGPGRLLRRVLLQGISLPQRNRRLRALIQHPQHGGKVSPALRAAGVLLDARLQPHQARHLVLARLREQRREHDLAGELELQAFGLCGSRASA